NIIDQYNLHGEDYMNKGDYVMGEKYFLLACAYTDTLLSPALIAKNFVVKKSLNRPLYAFFDSYDKLATLYMRSGNFGKSEFFFNTSIRKRNEHFSRKSVHRVMPYLGLGKLYFATHNYGKAHEYFSEVRNLLES